MFFTHTFSQPRYRFWTTKSPSNARKGFNIHTFMVSFKLHGKPYHGPFPLAHGIYDHYSSMIGWMVGQLIHDYCSSMMVDVNGRAMEAFIERPSRSLWIILQRLIRAIPTSYIICMLWAKSTIDITPQFWTLRIQRKK